ncbi:MAG TPA: hypothetical protein VM580_12910, partial [Labilithrix sp.]|nr:hypothetical protein [Labilithrix sp.]
IRPFRDALRADLDETYEGNRALLRLALGQYVGVVDDLDALNELLKSSDRLWAYRLEALVLLGRVPEARAGLEAGRALFGDSEHLHSVEERLESKEVQLRVELETVEHSAARVRLALGELRLLPLAMQAKACERELLDRFVLRHVRRACAELMDFVVFLKGGDAEPHEEALNALFRQSLGLRTAHLGWSCHGEDPGGHTSGKRWGSRDLILAKDATPFAAVEALRVLGTSASALDEVRKHYVKLFGYTATCSLRFLVAWSFVDDVGALEGKMKEVARAECPREFPLVGDVKALNPSDAGIGPLGFTTTHNGPTGEVHVVHLVVDLRQRAQKLAAVAGRS